MRYLGIFTIVLFGLLLPIHGGLTVFWPWLRYWKEFLLLGVGVLVLFKEVKYIFDLDSGQARMTAYIKTWKKSELLALALIIWLGFLVLIDTEKIRALLAVRYLALLPAVYLVLSRLSILLDQTKNFKFKILNLKFFVRFFCSFFLLSTFISVVFGSWVKFGSGSVFVQQFYSTTISSWVPGQTLPIWHEIDGVMRMQGLASGPVAFGHLCLLALGLLWQRIANREQRVDIEEMRAKCKVRSKKTSHPELNSGSLISFFEKMKLKIPDQIRHDSFAILVQIIGSIFLFWAIWQSGSRAALFAAVLLIIWQFFWYAKDCNAHFIRTIVVTVFILSFVGFGRLLYLRPPIISEVLNRAGTSDHFTRPVEAFELGLTDPLTGKLGQLGPAARIWNLKHLNDDKALLAENVYIDYFAQTGLIGFGLFIGFFFRAMYGAARRWRGILLVLALTMCLATLIDMTPISITLGILLAVGNLEKMIHE